MKTTLKSANNQAVHCSQKWRIFVVFMIIITCSDTLRSETLSTASTNDTHHLRETLLKTTGCSADFSKFILIIWIKN